MAKLNLQQLAAVINDEDLLVQEVIDRKLLSNFSLEEIMSVSLKMTNNAYIQERFSYSIINMWSKGLLPTGFKISKEIDPREEVPGGWKWNSYLMVDNLEWDNPIFEGKPVIEVTGNFDCSQNNLTSLEGSPKIVGGDFYCYRNKLISLEGGPEYVAIDFDCYNNKLTSLEGAPVKVGGDFDCESNPDLPKE